MPSASSRWLAALPLLVAGMAAAQAPSASVRLLVQDSPLAGFRYHEAARAWDELRVGDALELARHDFAHVLAEAYQHPTRLQVGVQRHGAVVVQHADEVRARGQPRVVLARRGVAEAGFRLHHHAIACSEHGSAERRGEVDRVAVLVVGVAEAGERLSFWERRRDARSDRIARRPCPGDGRSEHGEHEDLEHPRATPRRVAQHDGEQFPVPRALGAVECGRLQPEPHDGGHREQQRGGRQHAPRATLQRALHVCVDRQPWYQHDAEGDGAREQEQRQEVQAAPDGGACAADSFRFVVRVLSVLIVCGFGAVPG